MLSYISGHAGFLLITAGLCLLALMSVLLIYFSWKVERWIRVVKFLDALYKRWK